MRTSQKTITLIKTITYGNIKTPILESRARPPCSPPHSLSYPSGMNSHLKISRLELLPSLASLLFAHSCLFVSHLGYASPSDWADDQLSSEAAGKHECKYDYRCPKGYVLKTNLVTSPKKWIAIPLGRAPSDTWEKGILESGCTCQKAVRVRPNCSDSTHQYKLNPVGRDFCLGPKGEPLLTRFGRPNCPEEAGASPALFVTPPFATLKGEDRCYYYAKPTR